MLKPSYLVIVLNKKMDIMPCHKLHSLNILGPSIIQNNSKLCRSG